MRKPTRRSFWQWRDSIFEATRVGAAFFGAALLGLAYPLGTMVLFGWVVPQTDFSVFSWLIVGLLLCALSAAVFELVGGRYWLRTGQRAERYWVPRVWARLIGLPRDWLRRTGPAESGARAQAVPEILLRSMEWAPQLNAAAAVALANLLYLFFINQFLAMMGLLCAMGVFLVLIALNQHRARALGMEFRWAKNLHSEALRWMRDADSIRLAGAWSEVENQGGQLLRDRISARRESGWGEGWRVALFAGATALPCLILFAAVDQTDLAVAPFLSFLVAFGTLIGSLRILADAWPVIAEIRALIQQARPLWDMEGEGTQSTHLPFDLQGGIEMTDVSFRYTTESPMILDNFSMRIAAGEMVGLTGPSGCGKSTVAKLLAGLETPDSGQISVDQLKMDGGKLGCLAASIGIAQSRGTWYPGDLLANILSDSDQPIEEAWYAAELAGIADEIRGLPMQMRTLVAEGAANFSSSQRQRILIARALACHPRILILDEVTNSLDAASRRQLMKRLATLGITRLIISHRPTHLVGVDRLISMTA